MDKYYCVFDFIAKAIGYLDNVPSFDEYSCKNSSWHSKICDEIYDFIPEIYDKSHQEMIILKNSIVESEEMLENLEYLLEKFVKDNDEFKIIKLLQMLDESLEAVIKDRLRFIDEYIEMKSLNNNIDETGVLVLPFYRCSWQRNSRSSQHGYTINHYLQNIYCIMKYELKDLEIKNIVVDDSLFYHAKKDGVLKIGISPVTCEEVISEIKEYTDESGTQYFYLDGIENRNLIRSKVTNIVKKAKNMNIDILVFPEMLGFSEIYKDIRDLLSNNIIEKYSPLIVMPSIWENGRNACDVIIDDAALVITQAKQKPMIFNGKKEFIIPDRILYVIHTPLIGRICVLICKDMLILDYLDIILKQVQASLLIVPSFTTGSYDFQNAFDRCKAYDCDVVWINSCAAHHLNSSKISNFNCVGTVLKSGKQSNEKDNFPRGGNYCINDMKKCRDNICLFESEIALDKFSLFNDRKEELL